MLKFDSQKFGALGVSCKGEADIFMRCKKHHREKYVVIKMRLLSYKFQLLQEAQDNLP